MLLDKMSATETTREFCYAKNRIEAAVWGLYRRSLDKKVDGNFHIHSLTVRGTKYYYLLRLYDKSNRYRGLNTVIFSILRHDNGGHKYILMAGPPKQGENNYNFKSYEFHFLRRYAERKQGDCAEPVTDEEFVKIFRDYFTEKCEDPAVIYLTKRICPDSGEREHFEFIEKSSVGAAFGTYRIWDDGVLVAYKTFVRGDQTFKDQKGIYDHACYQAWAEKIQGQFKSGVEIVNLVKD